VRSGLYTPAYGGFFEVDLEKERKISLRTLVGWRFCEFSCYSFHALHVKTENGWLDVVVQIDRSALESFGGGGRVCIMARVYPVALADNGRVHMYAFNNGSTTVRVPQLRAWSMMTAQVNVNKG
jgi:beta-fructofuranosidase